IIEEQRAVEQIDEILAVPGIDVVFIGVNDLSYSMGIGGQMDSPKFKEAVAKVVAAAKKRNLPVGRPGGSPEQVAQFQKEGFTFFQGPSDLVLMGSGGRTLLQPMGKTGRDPKSQPIY
ncbi:MAG TPA: aldolase/citrate lyase family protein, partial [Bryobacteraceae bacterium]|nr:aldolase/citrate lyase family protein [Bryobacteraceae bacterium]